jgi:hypothetical protein
MTTPKVFDLHLDYGAACDGVTDDTTAWNNAIAAVNAGTVQALFIPPGSSVIAGNTTQITKPCSIQGPGVEASRIRATGAGTSIVLDFNNIGDTGLGGRMRLADFGMDSDANYTRQAIRVDWAAQGLSQGRLTMEDVELQRFLYGIELNNCIGETFVGVRVFGGNADPFSAQWAWNVTTDVGAACADMRWTSCVVAAVDTCWKASGHIEGFLWEECIPGFCNTGFSIAPTNTANPPYFSIHGVNCEFNIYGVYMSNVSDVIISDSVFFTHDSSINEATSIAFDNATNVFIHDNMLINLSGTNANNSIILYRVNYGKVHSNTITGLRGTGITLSGTSPNFTNNVETYNNSFKESISANSYLDTTGTGTNRRWGQTHGPNAAIDPDVKSASMAGTGTVTTTIQEWVYVDGPSLAVGDRIQLQAFIYCHTSSVPTQAVTFRIKDKNSASTFVYAYDKTNIFENRLLSQALTYPDCLVCIDAIVDCVTATATPRFHVQVWTDNGTCAIDSCQLKVRRL